MAEPLATSDDVVERLGRALTTVEAAKIDALLLDVSSAIRAYTHQTFTVHETTALLPIRNRAVRLPQGPVTAVASVEDGLGNDLSYQWLTGDERITLFSSGWLNEWELNIVPGSSVAKAAVTYTHGYYPIPDDIVGMACHIALRSIGTPSIESGMTSETIAGYSYTIGSTAGAGPFGIFDDEKVILDRYQRLAGPIPVM